MKKILLLTLVVLGFLSVNAQIDPMDAQLFGSSRGGSHQYASYNLQNVNSDVATQVFTLKNSGSYDMTISESTLPEGVSVLIPQKTIPAGGSAEVIVSVYRKYLSSPEFDKELTIRAKYFSPTENVTISKDFKLKLTGNFDK